MKFYSFIKIHLKYYLLCEGPTRKVYLQLVINMILITGYKKKKPVTLFLSDI